MAPPSHSAESTYVNHQKNHDASVILTAAADLASVAGMLEAQHDTTVDITIPVEREVLECSGNTECPS
jgi:phosphoribosylcarboxyaminoimidazole (NCAIR) mutase